MIEPLDERLQFYIRHHSVIREWVRLEKEWNEELNEFLSGQDKNIANALPKDIIYFHYSDKTHPKHFLFRASWCLDNERPAPGEQEQPFVAIGVEWSRENINFLSGEYGTKAKPSLPYYGLWVNRRSSNERSKVDRFQACLKGILGERTQLNYSEEVTPWWPLRKYFEPFDPDEVADSLKRFEHSLPRLLIEAWTELSERVEEALRLMRQE